MSAMGNAVHVLDGHLDHPIIGKHIVRDGPDHKVDFGALFNDPNFESLSSSEVILVNVALAIWNGGGTATVADLFRLDKRTREHVFVSLQLRSSEAY